MFKKNIKKEEKSTEKKGMKERNKTPHTQNYEKKRWNEAKAKLAKEREALESGLKEIESAGFFSTHFLLIF